MHKRKRGHAPPLAWCIEIIDHLVSLEEAIQTIHPMMLNPENLNFEGVFINYNTSLKKYDKVIGHKYKCGRFEEQPRWVIPLGISNPTVALLQEVYQTRSRYEHNREPANQIMANLERQETDMKNHELDVQIDLAFKSVMSKRTESILDIKQQPREQKNATFKEIGVAIESEVLLQYSLQQIEHPNIENIRRKIINFVPKTIMMHK